MTSDLRISSFLPRSSDSLCTFEPEESYLEMRISRFNGNTAMLFVGSTSDNRLYSDLHVFPGYFTLFK